MKTTKPNRSLLMITLLAAALSAPAWAQTDTGAGPGMGPAARSGHGMRAMRFDQGNTLGWTLMTPQERNEHQSRMRAVTSYDECLQLQQQHRQAIEARAAEKSLTLRQPRQNVCDVMKARGLVQ